MSELDGCFLALLVNRPNEVVVKTKPIYFRSFVRRIYSTVHRGELHASVCLYYLAVYGDARRTIIALNIELRPARRTSRIRVRTSDSGAWANPAPAAVR